MSGVLFTEPDSNGCAHMIASAEAEHGSPVDCAADRHRLWMRTMLTDLAREAGIAHHDDLARQLHLLYDGAGTAARMDRDPSAATTAPRGSCSTVRLGRQDRRRGPRQVTRRYESRSCTAIAALDRSRRTARTDR
jgi:hypothetical protein